jgi:Ca-activated chloride channel family protein
MVGDRLEAAKEAITKLIDRLDPADRLGIVTFSDEVQVPLPARELSTAEHRDQARHTVAALQAGGMTNLSGGLLRGLQEARRATGDHAAGATLLLLSDGHANQGETDPARLATVATGAHGHGITTSTIGIGLDYDETLLAELAGGGQGNHTFAEHGDAAAAAVAAEVEGLLSKTVQAASLTIRPAGDVHGITVWNDLPASGIPGGIMVELGDLWAGERRKLVLSFQVPAMSALGLAQVAELELRYVTVPGFAEQTISIPVHVNVVPGDQAAGRIPDPQVRTELVYQQAQEGKRRAADALRRGDVRAADRAYDEARERLERQMQAHPSRELGEEREIIARLRQMNRERDLARSAKAARMDHHYKSRRRGRRGPEV